MSEFFWLYTCTIRISFVYTHLSHELMPREHYHNDCGVVVFLFMVVMYSIVIWHSFIFCAKFMPTTLAAVL